MIEEITMFVKGYYDIGYSIAKKSIYKLRIRKPIPIGAYEVTFNEKTFFVVKAATLCQGYFIRKSSWIKILNSNEKHMINNFKTKILL